MPEPIDALIPPNPDEPAKADAPAPKRPTTRAGRKAAAAAKKASSSGSSSSDSRPRAGTPAPRKASLEMRLTDSFVSLGTVVMVAGGATGSQPVQADGVLIVEQSASLAKGLDQVAKNDPRVARALERMLTVGTYGALIGAVTPLALGIAANHGLVPPQIAGQLGVTPPTPDVKTEDGQPFDPARHEWDGSLKRGPGGPVY